MSEKQLELGLGEHDASSPPDAPLITPDLIEASSCLDNVFRYGQRGSYRDAHTYALKLRYAADCLARELEKYIY